MSDVIEWCLCAIATGFAVGLALAAATLPILLLARLFGVPLS